MSAGHVLVVDDEKSQRDIMTMILEGEGYTVEAASNVTQALSFFRSHHADVVLTDLSMPDRDGLSLLEELVKLDPEALGDPEKLRQVEVDAFVTRPLNTGIRPGIRADFVGGIGDEPEGVGIKHETPLVGIIELGVANDFHLPELQPVAGVVPEDPTRRPASQDRVDHRMRPGYVLAAFAKRELIGSGHAQPMRRPDAVDEPKLIEEGFLFVEEFFHPLLVVVIGEKEVEAVREGAL